MISCKVITSQFRGFVSGTLDYSKIVTVLQRKIIVLVINHRNGCYDNWFHLWLPWKWGLFIVAMATGSIYGYDVNGDGQ